MNANSKTKRLWLGAAVMAMAFSGSALAAATGIASTKHNLSSNGTSPSGKGSTDQICVFCHTPHGSETKDGDGNAAAVPLWNRKLGAQSGSYTLYSTLNTATLKGEVLAVGSVSLACLSCHDGTQAMNNLVNAPGSGGYNSAGAIYGSWTAGASAGTGGIIGNATDPIPRLGTDLTNDHPIGIEYCGGDVYADAGVITGTCKNPDFIGGKDSAGTAYTATSDGRTASVKTATVNNNVVYWVDVDGNAGRGKGDIQLYSRNFAAGNNRPSVECGSCHDPHMDSTVDSSLNFMRVTTAGSKICLSCHVK